MDNIGRVELRRLVHNVAAERDAARKERDALEAEGARKDAALKVIGDAASRSEAMFGGKMSEVTRVFENITRVSRAALSTPPEHGEKG